jgi:hypothetical protein
MNMVKPQETAGSMKVEKPKLSEYWPFKNLDLKAEQLEDDYAKKAMAGAALAMESLVENREGFTKALFESTSSKRSWYQGVCFEKEWRKVCQSNGMQVDIHFAKMTRNGTKFPGTDTTWNKGLEEYLREFDTPANGDTAELFMTEGFKGHEPYNAALAKKVENWRFCLAFPGNELMNVKTKEKLFRYGKACELPQLAYSLYAELKKGVKEDNMDNMWHSVDDEKVYHAMCESKESNVLSCITSFMWGLPRTLGRVALTYGMKVAQELFSLLGNPFRKGKGMFSWIEQFAEQMKQMKIKPIVVKQEDQSGAKQTASSMNRAITSSSDDSGTSDGECLG